MTARLFAGVAAALVAASCSESAAIPVAVDTRNDMCRQCRMPVSNARLAGQVVAPGEEPVFFDDIGCLFAFLHRGTAVPEHAVAYVADHRTGEWVEVTAALFTRVPAVETPMGSHLIAHASSSSRGADPASRGGTPIPLQALLAEGSSGGTK